MLAIKGRGISVNPNGRFARSGTVPLETECSGESAATGLVAQARNTRVSDIQARSAISRNQSPDIPFDQSINPYQGCEHGCVYCYARPSHAYHDLSPGLDFETRLLAKNNIADLLAKELGKPGYQCKEICIGANTDAYQPIEKTRMLTREILEQCINFNQPVRLITKSSLILRDLDLLTILAQRQLVSVTISVTTLSDTLKRQLEPRTASPARRLAVVEALASAQIPVGVLMAPVIPKLNDHEIEKIAEKAAAAGATALNHVLLRLPHEVLPMFVEWLDTHYPLRAKAVMSLLRQCHEGQPYRSAFGTRMRGKGQVAELIAARVRASRRRWQLKSALPELDTSRFCAPNTQFDLF